MTTIRLGGAASQRPSASVATLSGLVTLWGIYLLLAPTTGFDWIDSWHNEQRSVQVILLALTGMVYAAMTVFAPTQWRELLKLPWWWLAFLAIGITSALRSAFPLAALSEVGLATALGALVALTAALTKSRPSMVARAACYFALLICAAHVLSVLVRFCAALQFGNEIDLSVFMLGYANPRFASSLHALLIPFVALLTVDTRERRALRAAALLVLCLLWTVNLGLGTRGIWFAYGLAVPALLLLNRSSQSIRIVGVLLLTAMIGGLLFQSVIVGAAQGAESSALPLLTERLQTLSRREVLWALSWDATIRNPLLGLGPMHFATLGSEVGAHPHSWPLQIASEWGLPALALLAFALVWSVVRARNSIAWSSDFSIAALLAATVALVYGLVDGMFVMPVSQTASALVLGLWLGSTMSTRHDTPPRRLSNSVFIGAVATVATASVCGYALWSYGDQARSIAAFRAQHPDAWLTPRFWDQGQLLDLR